MSFRDNLQRLRAERHLTQEQLAMLLGVSRQSVGKWEAERSYPEMDKLLKLCDLFGCSLDDLVTGDLVGRATPELASEGLPGLPADVCGYDEHQRMMAWKVPTGIAVIVVGIAVAFFFEGAVDLGLHNGHSILFILIVLLGVVVGLVFLIPSGMAHTAFVKAHPYVEDFYTEGDCARARRSLSAALVAGIACMVVGIGIFLVLMETDENAALFFVLFFAALGVWNIVHYGMLLGRTNVAAYNRSVVDELELEDIAALRIDEARREALLGKKRFDTKLGAVCGSIMILATLVGLALLFAPVIAAPDLDAFTPEGTTAPWFWVAWPIGGATCGIVALLWEAFRKRE